MTKTTVTNATDLHLFLTRSYLRTQGATLTAPLPGATIRVPAHLHVDDTDVNGDTVPRRVNVGRLILDAVAFHVDQWGLSEYGAMKELAGRYVDMVTHPNAPQAELVAIDWALDLDALINPAGY